MNQKLIISLVAIPILFGIFGSWKEMSISVVAICLALSFSNLDKFSRIKGAGFEAELKNAVDKAYAAIEQLKELGISLTGPIVDELSISGRLAYFHLKYKLERVAEISDTLKKLGASQQEIDKVCSTLYDRVTSDHLGKIFISLKNSNPEKDTLFKDLVNWDMASWDKEKINVFIKEHNLIKNGETEEYFLDLDYFFINKKLRREDKWLS